MNHFELVQKKFAIIGYSLHYSTQRYHLNARNMTMIVLMVANTLATGVYIFYGAKSFDEFLENIYLTTTLAVDLAMCVINIVLMPKIFKLIENLTLTVNKSEYNVMILQHNSLGIQFRLGLFLNRTFNEIFNQ